MYNQLVKEEFLNYRLSCNETITTINRYKMLFRKVESFESVFNKDIAEMSYLEMQYTFSNADMHGTYSHSHGNFTLIKKYLKWCKDENKFKLSINLDNITLQMFISLPIVFKKNMIASPQDLINKCNLVLPDVKELKIENFIRATLYLIFCGLNISDILEIKSEQLEDLIKQHLIYSEFHDHLRIINDMTFYYRSEKEYRLSNLDLLIKNLSTKDKTISRFQNSLSHTLKKYNDNNDKKVNLRFTDVWKSGVYYRTYLQDIDDSPLKTVNTRAMLTLSSKNFEREYQAYKQAFEY